MFTERFNKAIITILKHEGGLTDDATDPGGITNFGVSLRFLANSGDLELGDINHDGKIDYQDIKELTLQEAQAIYFKHWWLKYDYEQIADLVLVTKVFDASVNMGGKQAHILLQRAIRACGLPIEEDGVLGPKSYDAIEALTLANSADAMVACFRSEQAGFYRALIAAKPVMDKYRKGWLNRAYS